MTDDQIKLQQDRLTAEKQIVTAQIRLGEISRGCTDHVVIKGRTFYSLRENKIINTMDDKADTWNDGCFSMSCAVCGKDLGWHCPVNPKGYCEYDWKKHGENCIHCHIPKERK